MVFSVLWPLGWHSFKQQVLFQARGWGEGTQQPHSQLYRVTNGITFHYRWCAQKRNYFPIKTFKRICGLWGHRLVRRLRLSISRHLDYLASCFDETSPHCLWELCNSKFGYLAHVFLGFTHPFLCPFSCLLGNFWSPSSPSRLNESVLSYSHSSLLGSQQQPLVYLIWNTSDLSSPPFPLQNDLFHSNVSIKYATINRNPHLKQYRVFFLF